MDSKPRCKTWNYKTPRSDLWPEAKHTSTLPLCLNKGAYTKSIQELDRYLKEEVLDFMKKLHRNGRFWREKLTGFTSYQDQLLTHCCSSILLKPSREDFWSQLKKKKKKIRNDLMILTYNLCAHTVWTQLGKKKIHSLNPEHLDILGNSDV